MTTPPYRYYTCPDGYQRCIERGCDGSGTRHTGLLGYRWWKLAERPEILAHAEPVDARWTVVFLEERRLRPEYTG